MNQNSTPSPLGENETETLDGASESGNETVSIVQGTAHNSDRIHSLVGDEISGTPSPEIGLQVATGMDNSQMSISSDHTQSIDGSPAPVDLEKFKKEALQTFRILKSTLARGFFQYTKLREIPQNIDKLVLHAWAAIIDTLIDPLIVNNVSAAGGNQDGMMRIGLTRAFFGAFLGKQRDFMDIIRDVNERHLKAGVVEKNEDGTYRVTEKYIDSFNYIAAGLVHEILRGWEDMGMKPGTPDYERMAKSLVDLWYGTATKAVGGVNMPKNFLDHDAFIKAHEEKNLADTEENNRSREKGREIAMNIIPWLANERGISARAFVESYLRPEVTRALGLDTVDWEAEEKNAKDYYRFPNKVRRVIRDLWDHMTGGVRSTLKQASYTSDNPVVRALSDYCQSHPDFRPKITRLKQKPREKTQLIVEGQKVTEMYITLTSSDVTVTNSDIVRELNEPTVYGEIGMLTRNSANATVTLEGNHRYITLTRDQFNTLLQSKPFRRAVMRTKLERLQSNAKAKKTRDTENITAITILRGRFTDLDEQVDELFSGDAALKRYFNGETVGTED